MDTVSAADDVSIHLDFETFYRAHLRAVVAVVYALCGNRWIAEDLAHDAFLAAYRRWDGVSGYENPGAFVRRAAINLAHSRTRRLRAETRALARYVQGKGPAIQPVFGAPEEFWSAVRRLPRRQAEVVTLRCLEEATDAEVASILGISESTVRVHAHNARLSLARALGADEELT